MPLPPRFNPQVGDLVVARVPWGPKSCGIVLETVNNFYWLDYKIILPSGRTVVLGRSSIMSCDECSPDLEEGSRPDGG